MTVDLVPTVILGRTAHKLSVTVAAYKLDGKPLCALYELIEVLGEGKKQVFSQGEKIVPEAVVQSWGFDDSVIVKSVATQLGLTIIPT